MLLSCCCYWSCFFNSYLLLSYCCIKISFFFLIIRGKAQSIGSRPLLVVSGFFFSFVQWEQFHIKAVRNCTGVCACRMWVLVCVNEHSHTLVHIISACVCALTLCACFYASFMNRMYVYIYIYMMHNEKATSLNVCVCAVSAHRYAQCTRFFIYFSFLDK